MGTKQSPIQNPPQKSPNWMLRFDITEFKTWKTKQTNNILFFDGSLQRNPGATRAGGLFISPEINQSLIMLGDLDH
jgi:hypothetical protein